MPTRKRKKPPKIRKKILKKKTFKKKTFKKKTLKKKFLKKKTLVKKYKMRGGKLVIPDDIPIQVVLENYKDNEKALELKNIDSKYNTVRAYIEPTNENTKNLVAELKNNEVNKTATIIEVGQGNKSFAMVRINYGPFYVASKHIINGNELYNIDGHPTVRVYDGNLDDSAIEYIGITPVVIDHLYSIKNNCPINIIERKGFGENSLTKIDLIVWVSIDHLHDPTIRDQQAPPGPPGRSPPRRCFGAERRALRQTQPLTPSLPHSSSGFSGPFPSPGPSTNIASSSTDMLIPSNTIQTNINNLFECYNFTHDPTKRNGQPPEWSKDANIVMELGNRCNVYYNIQDNIHDIEKLVREREPVNIAMVQYYNKDLLQKYFNYEEGYYKKIPVSKSCPPFKPNILVYTPTYLNQYGGPIYHILNVIGLAFDDKRQEDYQILIKHNDQYKISICKEFYMLLFQNIYNVAMKLKMENIVMCYVGCGAFSAKYPGPGDILQDIWLPAFTAIFDQNVSKKLTIYTMGGESMGNPLTNSRNIKDIGLFPRCVNKIGNNEKTLYINAWDCWSVPGNGNAGDDSLDGYIGRVSNIGVLGTSLTNPFLNYIAL